MTVGNFCNDDMLHNLVTIGSMEGRSTCYHVPTIFSHILHVLPQCIPAFCSPAFYTYSVLHSCILSTPADKVYLKNAPHDVFSLIVAQLGLRLGLLVGLFGQLADKPTRRQPSRRQTNSPTIQLADSSTRQ